MVTNKGSTVITSITDSVFTDNDIITSKDGFRIAFGIDTRQGPMEKLKDILFLELTRSDGNYTKKPWTNNSTKLKLHTCTEDDFEQFYEIKDIHKRQFETLKTDLMCFD